MTSSERPPTIAAGEAVERAPVAAHDLLEGGVVAVADEVDEAAVRLRAQRRAEEDPGGEALRAVEASTGLRYIGRVGSTALLI